MINYYKNILILILFYSISNQTLLGQLRMPPIFSDGMILQRNATITVWGKDNAKEKITVEGSWGVTENTISDNDGNWSLVIETSDIRTELSLTIQGSSSLTFRNILFGEVWLCSGQSNMEMPLKGFINQPVANSQGSIVNSKNNEIRFFQVERRFSKIPTDSLSGEWKKASPQTVGDLSATAYHFARSLHEVIDVPIGLIHASWGGSHIEAWVAPDTYKELEESIEQRCSAKPNPANIPSGLFNGMINPIIDFEIKGVIWYQGESNVCSPNSYKTLFKSLITSWRTIWSNSRLPFYYVEIAPFNYKDQEAAYLREVQQEMMKEIDHVGMISTIDLGECNNIHPKHKTEVGERLAFWAMANTYGLSKIPYRSPSLNSVELLEENMLKLYFDHTEQGLVLLDKEYSGIKIAGEDKIFYDAEAKLNRDMSITVWSESVSEPVAVRYGFENCPKAFMFNTAGFPVMPFRKDTLNN